MEKSSEKRLVSRTRKSKLPGRLARPDAGKYQDLLNNIDQGVCIIRVIYDETGTPSDYVIVETNHQFDEQNCLKNLFHKECWFCIAKVARTGKSVQFDNVTAFHKDGIWNSVVAFPVGQPGENLIALIFNDVTERKRQEQIISQNQERFLSILNNSQDIIYCENLKTKAYEYFSPSVKEILGYTPEELCSMSIRSALSMIHPDFVSDLRNAYKLSKETGRAQVEYLQMSKNGNYLWVSNHMSVTFDGAGQPLYRYGNIRDITELKEIEQKLRRSQEKLELALDNGNIGVWEWDLAKGEVRWDERMERMFGLDPGTFEGSHTGFETFVHEEDLPHLEATISRALLDGRSIEAIYRTKPRDGKSNYITSKALVTRDSDGKPVNVTGVCFDVTDMKEGAERALISLNEELLRSNRDLQQFAYVASHDLQEPLRMVASFTQLLQMQYGDKLDEKAHEFIKYAVDGSKRMYDLLNGLLAYSRIHSRAVQFRKINLNLVLQKVQENLRLFIDERKAIISAGYLPEVNADENQMIQLFQNLIENGIKFSRGEPRITVSAVAKENKHIISVKDEGIGIEEQYFEKIFRIFQRLHCPGEYEGTGIGLAICKRIVERHYGEIWVESSPGTGSAFSFSLPEK